MKTIAKVVELDSNDGRRRFAVSLNSTSDLGILGKVDTLYGKYIAVDTEPKEGASIEELPPHEVVTKTFTNSKGEEFTVPWITWK